ncbi:MAG: hypothetical protein ABII01_02380 [Candidatus Woesearchaeota archaeon]
MDFETFERLEIERFMDLFYDSTQIELLLRVLPGQLPLIRSVISDRIKRGNDDFTQLQGTETLYLSDLTEFYFDNRTREQILAGMHAIPIDGAEIYSSDVAGAYKNFVYQDSLDKFRQQFSETDATTK